MARLGITLLTLISAISANSDSKRHTCEIVEGKESFYIFNWETEENWPFYLPAAVDAMVWIGLRLAEGSLVWEGYPKRSLVTGSIPPMFGEFDPEVQSYNLSSELCAALQKSTGLIKLIDCSSKINFTCAQSVLSKSSCTISEDYYLRGCRDFVFV
ncbi:hypothetical protein HELRODRAFT_177972 [Helobdella robusta]|uniref:C-type lectin domain-containing protein n=1 Tax=Helobdella robusta TaxID=6412 RepID=T1FCJ8_HELRO|nr:hypothetical protein HELRODRAFT_177972 [Helobdella robusta]ESN97541.1 hypothetical protein HELRODRAFT_177972 [Helobdella robusta]